jgi:hypothetical protein
MTALANVPVRRIIRAIADAAERWTDADFPPRVRLLDAIVNRTGYSLPVVEYALDQLFFSLTVPALESVIANELGSLDVLDTFTERPGRPTARALAIGRLCVISSRTTIGVAIVPAIFALCAKCDVLVKDREDGLVRAFFASLVEEMDEMRDAACAEVWSGDTKAAELRTFDGIVAFGKDATLEQIGAGLFADTRYIPFGSKASIGYIAREALSDRKAAAAIAEGAARDLVLYESEGCLSLHALFVERGGAVDPNAFAAHLAHAVERASVEFPPGERDARASARVANTRNLAAFRAAAGTGAVFSDEQATYLAVLDPPQTEPPAFLPRTVGIHSVDSPADALTYVQSHHLPIEAIALAGSRADLETMAIDMGANRIARFGDLQRPPLGDNHGGRPRIAEFVRWIGNEA